MPDPAKSPITNAPEVIAPDRCLTPRELARYWRTSPAYVRKLVRRGTLRAFLVNKTVRITPDSIRECEDRLAVRPAARRPRRRDDGIDPEIARLLGDGT